jgi:hypothetical protein
LSSKATVASERRRAEILLMLSRRLRPYAWMALITSCLLLAYCLFAIAMIADLGGAPNYLGDARNDALRWECALIVPGALTIASVVILVLTRRRRA